MLQQTYARRLDANMLKLIAILAMTADHLAWLLFPGYSTVPIALFLHVIGRLTCPIMCYFIAEGYHYTRSVRRYAARLFIFAFISHFSYIFASGDYVDAWSFVPFSRGSFFNQTGVMWSLAWGLVMLCINDAERLKTWAKTLLVLLICLVAFPADWSCIASLCVLSIGANRGQMRADRSHGACSMCRSTQRSMRLRLIRSTVFCSYARCSPLRCSGFITAGAAPIRSSTAS